MAEMPKMAENSEGFTSYTAMPFKPLISALLKASYRSGFPIFRSLCSTSQESELKNELIVERLDGQLSGVIVVGLNRPKAKNAFSKNLLKLTLDAVNDVKYDNNLRVLVLRSMTPGIFSAGADLKERSKMKPEEVGPFVGSLRSILGEIQNLPIPTIAAIDGVAVGGGMEVALTCDMRIAADNSRLGLVETKLAIIPGGGGTQNIARLVGPSIAKELVFTGRTLSGEHAERIGVVNHCVKQNEKGDAAYERALELAAEIAPNGPIALRMAKKAINAGSEVDLATGYAIEQLCYAGVIPTKDRLEGLKAFIEKRPPVYKGE